MLVPASQPEQSITGLSRLSVTAKERLVLNASPPPQAAAFAWPATIERPSRPMTKPSAVLAPAPATKPALPDGAPLQTPAVAFRKRDIGATVCVPALIAFSPADEPVPTYEIAPAVAPGQAARTSPVMCSRVSEPLSARLSSAPTAAAPPPNSRNVAPMIERVLILNPPSFFAVLTCVSRSERRALRLVPARDPAGSPNK